MTTLQPQTLHPPTPGTATRLDDRTLVVGLFVAGLVLRLPLRSTFLVNWDAVNFALAVDQFDLAHHQPHPPGYIGYIVLGRIFTWVVGDANAAFTLISALSGALLPVLAFLLVRRVASRTAAVVAALLLVTSPLAWYYSTVALSYELGAAIVLALALLCHLARVDRDVRALYGAAVLLALLGAIRQTDLLLLLPLYLFAAAAFPRRTRVAATALLGGLCVIWLVPLVWLAGGPVEYVRLAAQLASTAGDNTFILTAIGGALTQNLGMVAVGLVLGLFAAAPLVLVPLVRRGGALADLTRDDRILLLLWVAPAAATFLLVHTGQLGYVLLLLPVPLVALAPAFDRCRGRVLVAGALAIVANGIAFVALPPLALALSEHAHEAGTPPAELPEAARPPVNDQLRQFDVAESDEHWSAVIDQIELFDPRTTVLLALPQPSGSFRHLAYYLPDYEVFGVGPDRHGHVGQLVTASAGESTYELDELQNAAPLLDLPPGTRQVVVFDEPVEAMIPDGSRTLRFEDGSLATVVTVPDGSVMVMPVATGDDELRVAPNHERLTGHRPLTLR